jgi:transcriptional regulator with XRE-family HTH domain
MKTAAELVDTLFRTHLKADGREYSCQEVSKALDGKLDASYIAKVRKGVIKNPGRDALMHICMFFRVPASYFFPELESLNAPDEDEAKGDVELLRTAFRSMALSNEVQVYLEGLITALKPPRAEKGKSD